MNTEPNRAEDQHDHDHQHDDQRRHDPASGRDSAATLVAVICFAALLALIIFQVGC